MADYLDYAKLDVWQVSMGLCERIYGSSRNFPAEERFGLMSQIRRAAVSIPSNIAEGTGRKTAPDYLQFVSISIGSLRELETLIQLAHRLGYIEDANELMELCSRVGQMLTKLRQSLASKV